MVKQMDFSTLQNRYVFEIELQSVTALHIGGSQEEAIGKDSLFIRDALGHFFIPGSSLKGLFRTASERITHILQLEHTPCFLIGNGCEPHKDTELLKSLEQVDKKQFEKEYYAVLYEKLCPICRTYGGGSISSKVKFHHILFDEQFFFQNRTSNRIDRKTGAVDDGGLFSYEVVQPKEMFTLVIEAENMTEENLKILALALVQLSQNAMRFGGKQAKGLGQVAYVQGTVTEQQFTGVNKKQALEALLGLTKPNKQDMQTFLMNLFDVKEL